MKKRQIYGLTAGILAFSMLLTGCGDGESQVSWLEPEPMESGVLEESTTAGEAPGAEAENGQETEVRLLYNTGTLTEGEEAAAMELLQDMYQNIELEEYLGECIHMVGSDVWYESLTGRMPEGTRTYTLQLGDEVLFLVQVGFDISGEPYSNVYYPGKDGVILLKQAGSVVQLTFTEVKEGFYDGAFERWQIDSATGEIIQEKGTYSQGVIVGEYTVSVKEGTGEGDAFDLWNMRENFAYETTVTTYDEQGNIVEDEPEPTPMPSATPSATKKPTATATPTPTPTPTPEPTPAPTPTPAPAATPAPTPAPTPTPTPTPTPAPPSEPSTGEVDIEWSDDIM